MARRLGPAAPSSFANRTAGGFRGRRRTVPGRDDRRKLVGRQRLNSPNDIVCRSDGLLYFTDPAYGVEPSERALHFQGVFAARSTSRAGRALRLLADDFEKPNGLAFSPDEKILYVCDTGTLSRPGIRRRGRRRLPSGPSRVFARSIPASPAAPTG